MKPVDIANNALMYVGERSIASLGDEKVTAALCSQFYVPCRNSVFRSHPWSCATKRTILSPLKDKPVFGYSNQFVLPADFIRALSIECNLDYVIEQDRILTNADDIRLVYVFENEDVNTWDDLLIEAVSLSLAAKIAYPITASVSKEEAIKGDLERLLKKARAVNAQETPSESITGFPLYGSRF